MIRSQVLLTPELNKEIKKIAQKQGFSQSKVVRKLLSQALFLGNTESNTQPTASTSQGIYDLNNFILKNPRINGFKEIFSVGGKTIDIKILGDEAFHYYLKQHKLPLELEYQIIKLGEDIKELSLTKTLVVRRAYIVPGLKNPPGPRFIGLKPEKLIPAIKKIYDFAIIHEYHLKKESQICVFFYPFYDPKPLSLPIRSETNLPYGGYAIPLNKSASRVEVFAVWGNNEGVQSFDTIDRYIVDTKRKIIAEKDTPQKTLMLCTTNHSQSEKIGVPQDRQFEQVLSDGEILEVSRVVKELTQKYGLRRVEFSFDGQESIIFNESVPYEICDKKTKDIDQRGFIGTVSGEKDVESLRKLKGDKISNTIIYIDKTIVEKRAYDVLNSVAGLSNKFTVLYPGLSATAHAMRVLNDFGHTAIVVGNRTFKDGEEVIIKNRGNQINIDSVSKNSLKNFLIHLYDAKLYGREIVGGKAMNLSLLKSKGFNVPHGWVLTTGLFDKILADSIGKNKIQQLKKDSFSKMDAVKALSNLNLKIPKKLWKKITQSMNLSSQKKYAIRSSANVEDQAEYSFAGQFKTYLNINCNQIEQKVTRVIKSTFAPEVNLYLLNLGKTLAIKMAVVIQEMVAAEKSGVVFGKDVQTGDEDLIVIDVAAGSGEGVVEGTAKTQRVIYSRSKDAILNENLNQAKKLLSRMEIDALVEMSLSVEKLMDETQDIEWAIDKKGGIWLIQTRSLN